MSITRYILKNEEGNILIYNDVEEEYQWIPEPVNLEEYIIEDPDVLVFDTMEDVKYFCNCYVNEKRFHKTVFKGIVYLVPIYTEVTTGHYRNIKKFIESLVIKSTTEEIEYNKQAKINKRNNIVKQIETLQKELAELDTNIRRDL